MSISGNLTSLAAATSFQPPPPPPPPQVELQPTPPSFELDFSSDVNVQKLPPVAGVVGGSNSVSRKPVRPKRNAPEAEDTTATDSLLPPPPPTSSAKRRRGRPRGSVTKNRAPTAPPMPMKSPGVVAGVIDARDLKLHKILLSPGEDLSAKLLAFAKHGNRNFYIASHYGAVSQATLREPTFTGSRTFEGLYQIISFSGSLIQSEAPDGKKAWTGGLTVMLSGSDNSITVGAVAGPIIAATNMQVIVCSFVLPNEDVTEPATINTVNTTKTNGLATGGDGAGTSNVDNSGWGVSESAGGGVGDGAGLSIPDNFGMWKDVNDPDT